jgi:uncharacterized protein (TIGR02996 family)
MARNPDLVRTILARPRDDIARLVYADWLDENGDPAHAELIRVQCELAHTKKCTGARREALQAREAELLTDPTFHLPGAPRPFRYARGFIYEGCKLALTGRAVRFEAHPIPNSMAEWDHLPPELVLTLTPAHSAVLDRVLSLRLNLCALPTKGLKRSDPFIAECLRRVTDLECSEGSINPHAVNHLTKCPHLDGVTSITFNSAEYVYLPLIADLFRAPALPNVTALHLDGQVWVPDHGTTSADEEDVAEFVTRIGAPEKAAQLTHLQINYPVGDVVAQALLAAPHLRPKGQLCLFMNDGLSKAMQTALKKRFGKALRL